MVSRFQHAWSVRHRIKMLDLWWSAVVICLYLSGTHAAVELMTTESMHGLSTGIQKTVNVTKNALESQDDSRVLNEQGTQRQLLDDQRTSYDEWEANTHVDGESGYWVDTVYYTDDRTTTKEEDYDLEKVPERLAKTDEEYLEKDHYLEHSLYGGEHHYEERHHQIIHHKPINEDEEDHYEHHYQWRSGTHDTSGETEEYLHKEALRQTTFDGYEEGIDHENHVDRYEDPWLDSHEGEGGVHVHLSTHSNDITETSEHHNQHYASSGEQHTGHDVIYANNLEDFNYDDINSGSDTHKVSSHDKESSAYKKSSHDKGSSAPKKSSHDKGSSAPKKSSHDKGSSAPKKSSHDKESSASKKSGKSKKDSSDSKDKSTGSSKDSKCSKNGDKCSEDEICCKHEGLSCMSEKCCTNRDQTCKSDHDCCSEMICEHKKCTVDCSETGKDCSKNLCCKDEHAVCSLSVSGSKSVCCKEGNKPCKSDKDCCRGQCLYKEDVFGNELKNHGKVCTEDQTCSAQRRKTTKDRCKTDSECCGFAQGHQQCLNDHCCRAVDSECNDDKSCCSGICKDHRCEDKPCIPLSQPCIPGTEQASCCHAMVLYDQEERRVPVSCAIVYLSTDTQPECCITDGNYCSSSDQCCSDHECIPQLDTAGNVDTTQPMICGILPPPPCKTLGDYCDSTTTCCKLISEDFSTDPIELECASVVDSTLELITQTDLETSGLQEQPISSPKCCIPELKQCSEDQDCCGVSKCSYIHRKLDKGYQLPQKTCYSGKTDSCGKLGQECSKSDECCLAEILVSNSVHYIPLNCYASSSHGSGPARKKSCCINEGQFCDHSSSCCKNLECLHLTNLQGQKLLDQPKVCREAIVEPCKDIGDFCSSSSECCEAFIEMAPFISKVKPRCDKIPSITSNSKKSGEKSHKLEKACCLDENELCNDHSQCCGDRRCARETKNGSQKLWTAAKRCISNKQSKCNYLNEECDKDSDCCIIPVSTNDDLFYAQAKCQGPKLTFMEGKTLISSPEYSKGKSGGKKSANEKKLSDKKCCLENGSPCSSNDQCCVGYTCRDINGRRMCTPPSCSSIGEDCSETQNCCQLHEHILDIPICKAPFQQLTLFTETSIKKSGALAVSSLSYFAPLSFCCVPEGQICLRNSDCCDPDASCGHPLQSKTELWAPGEEPRRCFTNRCRFTKEYCQFNSDCCEEDTICSTYSETSLEGTKKKCCKVKGSDCTSSEDCCLGKCYQEEDQYGVLLINTGQKCLDSTCQESGQVPTGAQCSHASDCCGYEKGAHDCRAGYCCRPVGQSCHSGVDCCTEFCDHGVCSEKHCMYAGQPCTPDSYTEECCSTSVWTMDGDLEIPSSCGLAHSSVVWNGNHVVALHERTACCFEEGAVCNSDAQCCSGTHCVYENNQFGTTYINTPKRCLKNTCTALGKIASGEYCHSKDECCGSEIGLQDCVDGMCCRIDGFECETDSQCCGRSTCQADEWGHRTCQMPPCASLGRSCDQDFTCCLVTNQDREVEPHCYHDSSMNSMCCYPEGFDCTNDLECCPGSKCVIPTNHHGVLIFGGGPDKQTKCVTERCMLGYAKPPGHECSSTDECCGFEAGIQECRGACCIKDNEQCKHSHHCCNGFCDPRSKRCVDPSCRLLGHKCIPALEHSCCKTIIHETVGDFGDEFTRVFPDNTHKRYQNMHSEKLPSAALVKKEKHDGSWDLHYSPVAIEVVPVCRLNEDFFHTDPKCCIEYGLRCQRSRDCCQYQDGDTVDCVYQKDPFGVEVHVWGKFCLREEDLCLKQGTNGICTTDIDCCGSSHHGKNGEIVQICDSGRCCRTNSNKCYQNSECCSGYCDLSHSVCRDPPCVHINQDCSQFHSIPEICCKVDVFAAYNSDHLVDLVTPTCSRRPPMGYSCCMTEGQKCNVQSDCCRGPGSHSMHPEDDGIFPTDLICETAKDEFGVAQYGASKECIQQKHWNDLKSTGSDCLFDNECSGHDQSSSGEAKQRCYKGKCCRGLEQRCGEGIDCCSGYCDPYLQKCAIEPCLEEGEICHSGTKCCGESECHHQRDVFGVVLADDAMKCTSNKCAIHQLAPPNAPCLRDQDCCQTTNIQQCNADYRCCIIEDEQCAYHEQCCTKHCNPEVGICTQPPCRGLGEDCSAYSLNPQICCPLKILNDQSWGTPSLPHGLGEDRTLVQPSCQPLDSSFRLGCCLSLHSPCLTDSDCCQFNNRQVSCMLETDYFGIPIHNLDQPKRCLIKNEYCSQRKNGDLCSRDEDCCAYDNEDGALQRCGIVGQTGQSRCCKIQDQECRLDQECCTGHCDLWTHTCKIATCTKLGEECSAEPTCCPVPGRNDGNLIEPVCRVMGLSEEYLADANLNEYHSTYWKQCCVQIGDYCRVGMDCCGYQQRLSECSKETSVCVMTTNVYV